MSPPTTARRSALDHPWTAADSADLYQIAAWGKGYFAVSPEGRVVVRPDQSPAHEIDLLEVVEGLRERGLSTPVLVRISDILAHRLSHLHGAFSNAMSENDYQGKYHALYPVKVNQQRPVVEEIYEHGKPFGFGLEVGSKPELLAVIALADDPKRLIVCNGFKDATYLEAVVHASRIGRNIIPIIENFGELKVLVEIAKRIGAMPRIGVRVKLASQGAGRWRDSAGAKAKFGLTVTEVLDAFHLLRAHGWEKKLCLVHCHAGSQLQDIRRVKDAIGELAHVYAELSLLGAEMRYIDVGGGLGVDYDGSQTNYTASMNYSLEEYANEVVYRIASICASKGVEHPTILSESGRAIAAYQSVLIFDVLGRSKLDRLVDVDEISTMLEKQDDVPQPILDLADACRGVSARRNTECYHDAAQAREQALELFNLGYLTLEQRALAEQLFWTTCFKVRDYCRGMKQPVDELDELESILSDTYFCNISVFQSLPDTWAIDQLFPIMPLHRLDEQPMRKAVLGDITCDSDGRIDRFVDVHDVLTALDLHELREGEPYFLGAFLVGAYQETLGALHNLFGDTHVVHIRLHEEGGWWIDEIVQGDTSAEVLGYVQYSPAQLQSALARSCELAVRMGRLTVAESREVQRFYERELNGYTYLVSEADT